MLKLFIRSIFIIALIISSACGPIYDTQYQFLAPKNSAGKICVEQCPELKEQCMELEEINKENCDEINQRHIDDCNDKIAREKNRGPKWNECGKIKACGVSSEKCEEAYRNCYRSCGGEVRAEKVCIANCDQVK